MSSLTSKWSTRGPRQSWTVQHYSTSTLSTVRWVSEQLLNGTSAHIRLFSAIHWLSTTGDDEESSGSELVDTDGNVCVMWGSYMTSKWSTRGPQQSWTVQRYSTSTLSTVRHSDVCRWWRGVIWKTLDQQKHVIGRAVSWLTQLVMCVCVMWGSYMMSMWSTRGHQQSWTSTLQHTNHWQRSTSQWTAMGSCRLWVLTYRAGCQGFYQTCIKHGHYTAACVGHFGDTWWWWSWWWWSWWQRWWKYMCSHFSPKHCQWWSKCNVIWKTVGLCWQNRYWM